MRDLRDLGALRIDLPGVHIELSAVPPSSEPIILSPEEAEHRALKESERRAREEESIAMWSAS